MADEPVNGWLPPAAPGGRPPPRFEPVPEDTSAPEPTAPPEPDRPAFVRRRQSEPREPAIGWALGLGIAGLSLLVLSLGTFFVVTLPFSAAAWGLAERARKQAGAAEGRAARRLTAALWLGRIGVIVGVVAALAFFVLLAAGFDFEQLRQDLERELERQRRESNGEGVRTAVERLRATVGGLGRR